MSRSAIQKDDALLAALAAHLDGADIDIARAIDSQFIYAFGAFLASGYKKNYSPVTCCEILGTLRKYLRIVMLEGSVPAIDAVPAVIDRLDSELWQRPARRRADADGRLDLRVRPSVAAIMRYLDFWTTKQQMAIAPAAPADKAEALQNKCAALYLFCITTCGISVRDALAIPRDWQGSEIPDSVFVERYGMRLPLTPAAKKLVQAYNQGARATEHLFYTLDHKRYKGDLDLATSLVESHIRGFLSRPLFRSSALSARSASSAPRALSPFLDWLNLAIESGLPDSDAEALWRWHLGDAPMAAALPAMLAAQGKLQFSAGDLDETWYLLSVIPQSVKRDRFVRVLAASGILGEESEAKTRIYAPEDSLARKDCGEYPVFSRYIFFRGTPMQAQFANSYSPSAYVVRDKSQNRFAQISETELRHIQVMLRDFPDAVQLVDGDRWLQEHNARIRPGCKAVIRSGELAGVEAEIVEVKGKKTANPLYLVRYVQGAFTVKTALPGVLLDLVEN